MKKNIRLTESDLTRIVKRVIKENEIDKKLIRRITGNDVKNAIEEWAMIAIKHANKLNRPPMSVHGLLYQFLNNDDAALKNLVPTNPNDPDGDLDFDFGGPTEEDVLDFLEKIYGDMILDIYEKNKK